MKWAGSKREREFLQGSCSKIRSVKSHSCSGSPLGMRSYSMTRDLVSSAHKGDAVGREAVRWLHTTVG